MEELERALKPTNDTEYYLVVDAASIKTLDQVSIFHGQSTLGTYGGKPAVPVNNM